ncbi:MAG TPA: RNA polymerase sigma factor, partial [Miltoncostaeaceae bacterium]|nr:RNA polymerase sigma factor [Miltoncostaeaceae bacterium]
MATSVAPGPRPAVLGPVQGSLAVLGDSALGNLVAAGDERAFEALFERHQGEIYRYASAILRHPQDAEEVLQLTMLAAYRALSSGAQPRELRPWLFRIAHNESMDLIRARPKAEELGDHDDPVASVHETVEARERLRQLRADLGALPPRQRSALVLRELSGLSHAQIATALAITEAEARHQLFEARASLAEFGAGREAACADMRQRISDGDRRTLRARNVRAHLRECDGCRAFAAEQDERRRRLGAFFPLLPAAAAAEILRQATGTAAAAPAAASGSGGGTGAGGGSGSGAGGGAGAGAGAGGAAGSAAAGLGVAGVAGLATAGAVAAGVIATVAVTGSGIGPFAGEEAGKAAGSAGSSVAAAGAAAVAAGTTGGAGAPGVGAEPIPIAAAAAAAPAAATALGGGGSGDPGAASTPPGDPGGVSPAGGAGDPPQRSEDDPEPSPDPSAGAAPPPAAPAPPPASDAPAPAPPAPVTPTTPTPDPPPPDPDPEPEPEPDPEPDPEPEP